MYETVIVPLDGSPRAEAALEPAREVAVACGAAIVGLAAVDQEKVEMHRRYLERVTGDLGVASRPPYVLPGVDPATAIANAAEAPDSLVVMTTHGSSGLRRAVLGSVAEAVLRRSALPVLLVGPAFDPDRPIGGGRAVVALDGSERAKEILPVAAQWARCFDLEVWAVTVVQEGPEARDDPARAGREAGHVRAAMEELEAVGVRGGWEVLHYRNAPGPLVTFARGLPASVVAMTTHGHTGLARLSLGSVAARVVHDATCPVLVLRPGGLG